MAGKSLAETTAAVNSALAAVNGDAATTRDAILALAAKQEASNAAIHASLASLRNVVVQIATSLSSTGGDVDGTLLTSAQAVTVPDFDAATGA
jgi:hypothetical protein